MDPITTFSLAAGVLQVIDISFKAVKTCRELYKDGSLAKHRDTEELLGALSKASERLKAARAQATRPQSKDDWEIANLAVKCSELADDLLSELYKLRLEQSGFRQAIKKSLRAVLRKSALEEKQKVLEKYQSVLDTRVLIRLDTRSLKESQDIEQLDQSIRGLVLGLENGHKTFAQLLTTHSQAIQDHIDMKFESHTQATANLQARERLLKSLLFPEILSRQEQISEAYEGTYRWIFAQPTEKQRVNRRWASFRDWLEAGNDIYWISGKPGSGKSTLMKYIVGEDSTVQLLNKWRDGRELLVLTFFFWNAGTALQKSVTGLLRSLLYQIAIQRPELVILLEEKATGVTIPQNLSHLVEWTDERLLSNLKLFLDHKPSTLSVCAFIDGLDEFVGDEELLLDMVRILGNATGCKLCVSSRPEQAFLQEFRLCPQLRVQDLNREDIERTATGKLLPHLNRHMSADSERKESLISILLWKAQGVFLWLDLMIKFLIKALKNGDSYKQLCSRLDTTPDTINGMYAHILEELDPLYKEERLKYFHVLLAAQDFQCTLKLVDLVCAEDDPRERAIQFDREYFTGMQFDSACRHVETRLVACCGGLIEIQDEESEHEELEVRDQEDKDEDVGHEDEEKKVEKMGARGRKDDERENDEPKEEDMDKAAIISRHNRNVDFVHRTAMEYIREKHNDLPLEKSSSSREAHTHLCIGKIGQLILFSLTHTRSDLYESRDLADLFTKIMSLVSATEFINDTNKRDESPESFHVDLTHQTFQSLHHLYRFFHDSDQDPFSDASFLQCILRRHFFPLPENNEFVSWYPITDRLSAAAFFGCHQYVQCQLLTQSTADERIPSLFQAAISGLEHSTPRSRFHGPVSWLLLIRKLQQRSFDPNKLYIPSPISRRGQISYASLWGASLASIVRTVAWEWVYLTDAARLISQSNITDLVEKFLSIGADPNTRIVSILPSFHYRVYLEESPLAMVEFFATKYDFCAEIQARLRSAGAIHRRRFLCICDREIFVSDPKRRFYHLSSIQSEQLTKAMLSSWKGEEPWGSFSWRMVWQPNTVISKLLAEAERDDWIDRQTMLDEIRARGESF